MFEYSIPGPIRAVIGKRGDSDYAKRITLKVILLHVGRRRSRTKVVRPVALPGYWKILSSDLAEQVKDLVGG